MDRWAIGGRVCVYLCVCRGSEEKMEGRWERKKFRVYVCGRKGVGFSDVRMTSAAKGRCVKDTPASRGPPECVCV